MKKAFFGVSAAAHSLSAAVTIAIAASSFSPVATAQPSPHPPQTSTQQKTAITPLQDSESKKRLTDATFVQQAALGSFTEIELSKVVIKKTKNEKLRNFASQMISDHEATNIQLRQVAEKKGIAVPTGIVDADQQKTVTDLKSLSGTQLDQTYVDLMKKNHDTTVGLFDNAAGETELSPEFKNFAKATLPKLRLHQKNAHSLTETEDSKIPSNNP